MSESRHVEHFVSIKMLYCDDDCLYYIASSFVFFSVTTQGLMKSSFSTQGNSKLTHNTS
jgi:hypothetical protein